MKTAYTKSLPVPHLGRVSVGDALPKLGTVVKKDGQTTSYDVNGDGRADWVATVGENFRISEGKIKDVSTRLDYFELQDSGDTLIQASFEDTNGDGRIDSVATSRSSQSADGVTKLDAFHIESSRRDGVVDLELNTEEVLRPDGTSSGFSTWWEGFDANNQPKPRE